MDSPGRTAYVIGGGGILVWGRPRAGAKTSGKAIGWNRAPREDWLTIDLGALATAPRRGPAVRCRGIESWKGRASHSP